MIIRPLLVIDLHYFTLLQARLPCHHLPSNSYLNNLSALVILRFDTNTRRGYLDQSPIFEINRVHKLISSTSISNSHFPVVGCMSLDLRHYRA